MFIQKADLSQTTIDLEIDHRGGFHPYLTPISREDIVAAFWALRGLKMVKVRGIEDSAAAGLVDVMMKREPIENIWEMETALWDAIPQKNTC